MRDEESEGQRGGYFFLSSSMLCLLQRLGLFPKQQQQQQQREEEEEEEEREGERPLLPRSSSSSSPSSKRYVRLFLSSTFVDMHGEREVLAKRVLPRAALQMAGRGVTVAYVDLRWGITAEQSCAGRVLHTCLSELHACLPFFIATLGHRYGWAAASKSESKSGDVLLERTLDLAEKDFPYVRQWRDRSMTEIEVRSALRHARIRETGRVYLRDEACLATLHDEDMRAAWREEDEAKAERLAVLKRDVVASGVRTASYASLEAFEAMVLDDLLEMLDAAFPIDRNTSPLLREDAVHAAHAETKDAMVVPRAALLDQIDAYLAWDRADDAAMGPPLLVHGESGAGKSTLLARVHQRLANDNGAADVVVGHFCGCSAESIRPERMLARITRLLGNGEEDEESVLMRHAADVHSNDDPDSIDSLKAALQAALDTTRRRVVVIIDAVDQLVQMDAPPLTLLPASLPPNVRVVVSSSAPPPENGDVPLARVHVTRMTCAEKRRMVEETLSLRYGKSLTDEQLARVLAAPATDHALFMRVFLDEMRLFGRFEAVDAKMDELLGAENVSDLYTLVLARVEAESPVDNAPALLAYLFTAVLASRAGLTEAEAAAVVATMARSPGGDALDALPAATFSPLLLDLRHMVMLNTSTGLLSFFHAHVSRAVRDRYTTPESIMSAHGVLADYFEHRVSRSSARRRLELPHHLLALGRSRESAPAAMFRMRTFLGELEETFLPLWTDDRFLTLRCWRFAADDVQAGDMVARFCHQRLSASPSARTNVPLLQAIAELLEELECHEEALEFQEMALAECAPESLARASALVRKAALENAAHMFGDQEALVGEAMDIMERHQASHVARADALLVKAEALRCRQGRRAAAARAYRSVVDMASRLRPAQHARALDGLALMQRARQKDAAAEELYKQALDVARLGLGNRHPTVATILLNLAMAAAVQGKNAEARAALQQAKKIRIAVYGRRHPSVKVIFQNLKDLKDGAPQQGVQRTSRPPSLVTLDMFPVPSDDAVDLARADDRVAVLVGNLHEQAQGPMRESLVSPGAKNRHMWTVFVNPAASEVHLVKSVTFHLHPTFSPSAITVTSPPFCLRRIGWGSFIITVEILLVGREQPFTVEHDLHFEGDGHWLSRAVAREDPSQ